MLPSQGEGPNVVEGARGVERREARLEIDARPVEGSTGARPGRDA